MSLSVSLVTVFLFLFKTLPVIWASRSVWWKLGDIMFGKRDCNLRKNYSEEGNVINASPFANVLTVSPFG